MKYVKPLLPYEIFMANIEAGSEKELIIKDLVESYDLSITSSSHPFFTGKQKLVDTAGRVDKFRSRYGNRTKK